MKKLTLYFAIVSIVLGLGCIFNDTILNFCVDIFANRNGIIFLLLFGGIGWAVNVTNSDSIIIPRNGTKNEQKMAVARAAKEMGFDVKLPIE